MPPGCKEKKMQRGHPAVVGRAVRAASLRQGAGAAEDAGAAEQVPDGLTTDQAVSAGPRELSIDAAYVVAEVLLSSRRCANRWTRRASLQEQLNKGATPFDNAPQHDVCARAA